MVEASEKRSAGKRGWRRKPGFLAILLGAVLLPTLLVVVLSLPPAPAPLVISKETTYIESPLGPDGAPDYLAAIRSLEAANPTPPGSGAAPAITLAVGPSCLDGDNRSAVLRALGMEDLPAKGEYFIDIWSFAKARGEKAIPWKALEYPRVAEWLLANETPLRRLLEASAMEHFRLPLVSSTGGLAGAALFRWQCVLPAAKALAVRARRRREAEEREGAWDDALRALRLGCLARQDRTLLSYIVGNEMQGLAASTLIEFLELHPIDPPRARALLAGLRGLPGNPCPFIDILRRERLILLETAVESARADLRHVTIDINLVLRTVNGWFNRFEAALSESDWPSRRERVAAVMEDFERESRSDTAGAEGWTGKLHLLFLGSGGRRALKSRVIGNLSGMVLTKISGYARNGAETEAALALLLAAAALRVCQAEEGGFPERLEDLVPRYIPEVPRDPAGGGTLGYRLDGRAAVLTARLGGIGVRDRVIRLE